MQERVLPGTPHGTLVVQTPANQASLRHQVRSGRAKRLIAGLYVVDASLPIERVVQHHLYDILAYALPDGVVCGASALAANLRAGDRVYLAAPAPGRVRPWRLDGVEIVPVVGPGPLPGDIRLPSGIHVSGPARRLVENVDLRGRPAVFRAGTAAVEDAIDEEARVRGTGGLAQTLNALDVIAANFDTAAVNLVRARLRRLLGTTTVGPAVRSPALAARLSGNPYDAHQIERLERLREVLRSLAPQIQLETPATGPSSWQPFFEAYFSNFIEGTEFGVDDARRIATEGYTPVDRPADAHDVSATHRLLTDPADRVAVPGSGDDLVEMLRTRHAVLMAARPDKNPGEFKQRANFVGAYQFVSPELVEGTLRRGYDIVAALSDPVHRAVVLMVLITECHPFDDGNGRVARLTANAELSAAGQVRMIVPTGFRGEYISGLNAYSSGNDPGRSITSILSFVQRWTAAVDWSDYERAKSVLESCNAFANPHAGLASGVRLLMPGSEA